MIHSWFKIQSRGMSIFRSSQEKQNPANRSIPVAFVLVFFPANLSAETAPKPVNTPPAEAETEPIANEGSSVESVDEPKFHIRQIRLRGAKSLPVDNIDQAIYPHLGPGRTLEDLENARVALEKAYRDAGYQTVAVEIPQQNGTRGIIYFDVIENKVGRLRVRDAKFFLPSEIKRAAPSLAEGTVPDFKKVESDIVNLNRWADRRVTPSLKPGVAPGTVDVDLTVEDHLPLHGSIELNNRYSPDTTPFRINGSLSYDNLWQKGHSLGFASQFAPERIEDAEIYSAYYIARFSKAPDFSLMVMGTVQNSDISTLGGAAVAGRGQTVGMRFMWSLPALDNYYHSLSAGLDYKHFDEDVTLGDETFSTPIDYYPVTVAYGGGLTREDSFTEINAALNFHFRGMGSGPAGFDAKRYEADGGYIYFRGDLSHTQDLPFEFQAFAKAQAQASNDPLINSEQYAGGGLSNVRGYLESEALGDSGWFLTFELRTPSLLRTAKPEAKGGGSTGHEWRFHAFYDFGRLYLKDPLPEQQDLFDFASAGVGTSLQLWDTLYGYLDIAWPLEDQGTTQAGDPFLSFRVRADF